jgi:NADPH2:quinone reductase
MLANINLEEDLKMLKQFGRVLIVGSRGRIEIDPGLTMFKDSSIIGVALMYTTPVRGRP